MTPDFSDEFLQKERNWRKRINRKWKIRAVILLLHVLCIGVPLLWEVLHVFFRPPKVNAFRVKIGPSELSTSPVVGPPERKRPGSSVPEPVLPVEPKLTPPVKKPAPVKKQVKKQIKKPVQKKKVKKQVKKQQPQKAVQKKQQSKPRKFNRPAGGRNYNSAVPLGSRDRGQQKGRQDNRTPGGGLTEAEEQFNRRAGLYLKDIWVQPPKSLLGSTLPAVTIEIEIATDGRVLSKKITRPSRISAMDQSVETLLARLDRMPAPPRRMKVEFILMTDD